jgi:hypothetical protein
MLLGPLRKHLQSICLKLLFESYKEMFRVYSKIREALTPGVIPDTIDLDYYDPTHSNFVPRINASNPFPPDSPALQNFVGSLEPLHDSVCLA